MSTILAPMTRRALLRAAVGSAAMLASPPARACEFNTDTLTIVHPWVPPSKAGQTTAIVGMTFKDVLEADRLVGATTAAASRVELVDANGDVVPAIDIPTGAPLVLRSGGPHVRLVDLVAPLTMGDVQPFTLHFERCGPVPARLTVDFFFT